MMPPTSNPRLVSSRVTDGDARLAVNHVWQLVERPIRWVAGKFTDDPETMKDLVQEAMFKLWELEPSRIDIRNRAEVFYVRRALINRMWDVVRTEWLRVHPDGIAEAVARSALSTAVPPQSPRYARSSDVKPVGHAASGPGRPEDAHSTSDVTKSAKAMLIIRTLSSGIS
jgi:DNA-directed RNA polymerase specialized sigma24 family protein